MSSSVAQDGKLPIAWAPRMIEFSGGRPHPRMAQAFAILRFQNALAGREGPDLEQTYRRVIDVLSRVGAQWSVVGAHAVNVYVELRATVGVDFVVEARKMRSFSIPLR